MRTSITAILIAAGTMLTAMCQAQAQQTQKLTAAKHNDFGITYSLPITHFDITVDAEIITRTPGEYYKYAKKYLGVDNAITEPSRQLVVKNVTVKPYGVPDPNNQYLMQFKKGSPSLYLNKYGLPICLNIEPADEQQSEDVIPAEAPKVKKGSSITSTSALPGEMLMSESTAKKAEVAAQTIYKIRESRTAYITGEADQMPPDGESLKVTLAQLDKQEAALTALFLGTTSIATATYRFDFTPSEELDHKILFRLSDFDGLVDRNDLSGSPVYATLKITQKGEVPLDEKGLPKVLPKGAVIYNIPGTAQFSLYYNDKEIFIGDFQVAQYGIQFGVSPDIFTDKKSPSYMIFYPETGAVKEIGTLVVQ